MNLICNLKVVKSKSLGIYRHNLMSGHEIELYLHNISKPMAYFKDDDWDDLYSHVISHEHIHKVIYDMIGRHATVQFDNIAGKMGYDMRYIRTGLSVEC